MSFINKNANLILLFLIIVSAVTLVGATVFFQTKFEEINTEYNQKLQQLQTVSAELDQKQAALDKIQSDLNIKNEREQALGAQYSEVKQNKDQLETQKKQLESNKEQLEKEIEDTETELQSVQSELTQKKAQVADLTSQVDTLNAKVNLEENKRKKAQDDFSACQTAKALCTCPA